MMRAIGFLLAAMLLPLGNVKAQEVKNFETELRVGVTEPISAWGMERVMGPQLGIEPRWNLNGGPVDIGAEMYLGVATRQYHDGGDDAERIMSLSAVAHYNFNLGKTVSPFVGVGLGVADCTQTIGEGGLTNATALVFSPRVGVELWQHLRLTLDLRLARKEITP